METAKFAKQTLGFQRTIFDNSFNAMIMVQDQTEKLITSYLDQLPWITEENKKSLETTSNMVKKAREDFKKSVDDGYNKFEELLEEKK